MYWLAAQFLLCNNCGLIRIDRIPDRKSLQYFYEKYYRDIWEGSAKSREKYFTTELKKWNRCRELLENNSIILWEWDTVFEAWCWTGWCLYAFHEQWVSVSGCDYWDEYLAYWKELWMDLYQWWIDEKIKDNSIDLFMLLEVLEHLDEPINTLQTIIEKIKPWKYLLIWVPATRNFFKARSIQFFQYVHLFSYHRKFLEFLFIKLWLEIIYIDNRSDIILRKPLNRSKNDIKEIYDKSFKDEANSIEIHLKKFYIIKCLPIVILFTLKIDKLLSIYRKYI
jgi:hypothetical protein